jgi:hypothetical protein
MTKPHEIAAVHKNDIRIIYRLKIQGDQTVSLYLMITLQKYTKAY